MTDLGQIQTFGWACSNVRFSPTSDLGSARELVNSLNVFQTSIPIRTARDKNVGVGLSFYSAIEASSRDDQQSPIHLNTRKR